MNESSSNRAPSFFIVFFVLTIAFSLISAGILNANISIIGMAAYAKKSKESSGGSSSSGGGSSNDGGGSSGGSNDKGGGDGGGSSGTDEDNKPTIEEPSTPTPPPPPPIEEPTPNLIAPPPPPPATCEQGSTSPECAKVPEPPGPPVDCSTNPNDPSCKPTEPTPPVDCTANPNDPSCKTTTGPVDCSTNPDDPSCPPQPGDCTKNPDDPKCNPDCTKNPDDPKCNPDCTKNPDDPKCNPDCTKNPDDPKCNPDCTKNPDDPRCQPCPPAGLGMSCPPPPPPPPCQKWQHFDPKLNKCVPPCPPGYHLKNGVCVKGPIIICPQGYHLESGVCTRIIVKHVTTVETVVRNFITNQPKFLLLLDTAQLCQLAGDTQCVAKQNQFDTLNLVTKLDSTGKTWTITGQVENRVSKIQNNVHVIGYFYDSKGNNVGGPYKGTVNPTVLKSLQLGAFSMKPSTSIMKGTPSFLRLEYQSTAS